MFCDVAPTTAHSKLPGASVRRVTVDLMSPVFATDAARLRGVGGGGTALVSLVGGRGCGARRRGASGPALTLQAGACPVRQRDQQHGYGLLHPRHCCISY